MIKEAEATLDVTDDNLLFEGGAEALNVLLGGADASEAVDAEQWARVLQDRAQQLDTLNVQAMLAAATQGGGAKLGEWLIDSGNSASALGSRLHRYESITRGAEGAGEARGGAARADMNARALLTELDALASLLDPPQSRDLDSLAEISLNSVEGRERALSAGAFLLAALRGVKSLPTEKRWVLRLNGVKDRIRRLERARDALAAAIARHLNNALVHLGNEALSSQPDAASLQHHTHLKSQAQHVRLLRMMDEKAYDALLKVYVGTWGRVHERCIRGAGDAARQQLASAEPQHIDHILDTMLSTVDSLYTAEQEFCTNFFCLDADIKGDASDGDRSEVGSAGSGGGGAGAGARGAETRRLMLELFPSLELELLTTIAALDKHPYGAMRALACVSRRVLGDGNDGAAGAGGAKAALAAAAVAAKRAADRAVQERVASASDHVKQAGRRTQCGILGFIRELETFAVECERIFAGSARRADLERWYCALATAALQAIGTAEHPRTPRSVVQMENYHALHGALSAPPLRKAPALDTLRTSAKTHYNDALRHYVTHSFGRPLEKLNQFFEGVAEAVASGVREEEVCYRAAYSKHELKRLLQMYPAHEVRKSLHRLYRTVEKQLSEEAGLLQVVWRAMQEEFIAQHRMLQGRIAACYPGAGLSLPLTIQDILDAFSDIAREH